MSKRKVTVMVGVVFSMILLLGLYAGAKTLKKGEIVIKEGNNRLEITISNGVGAGEDYSGADGKWGKGINLKNLCIVDTLGTNDKSDDVYFPILEVPTNLFIATDDPTKQPTPESATPPMNPGCRWFFFAGQWWYLCD